MDESPKRIKTCCKADCKVDCKQDNKGSANKRCGLGKHPIPADEQEEFYKQIIHSSYLISFFWSVSIMDYTISFCICQALFSDLIRNFLYQILSFVFVIIILIVNILYLYRNNYHLCFVKNKSRGYFTTAFCISVCNFNRTANNRNAIMN